GRILPSRSSQCRQTEYMIKMTGKRVTNEGHTASKSNVFMTNDSKNITGVITRITGGMGICLDICARGQVQIPNTVKNNWLYPA
ncbi:MAG: hypothetical protein FWC60_10160, partial [Firmicutes bacterium]|nr:hypothetical protein [Bacillota bacterium]